MTMIRSIKGFKDILPGESELWDMIETEARRQFKAFGFKEIRIPVLEKARLFEKSIGAETDIVQKEMYTFNDRDKELVTLRPEATASIVRAYIQHKMYAQDPIRRLFTIGPMFRRERPQKGRYRQFYQIDAEILGTASPLVDAELIFMLMNLFKSLDVEDLRVHVNSLGCLDCRPEFKDELTSFLNSVRNDLCRDCQRRSQANPLRVLDCKADGCREAVGEAPSIIDHLCEECAQDFAVVKRSLDDLGVPFSVDPMLVRGLDYYTRTTFEIRTDALGAQNAIAGGGRYDGLIKMLGGPDLPATGFAIGFDRLVEVCSLAQPDLTGRPYLFVAALGKDCMQTAHRWVCSLAGSGIYSEMDYEEKSLKSQLKKANRLGAMYVLIFGDEEREKSAAILKNMEDGTQVHISTNRVIDEIAERFAKETR